MDEAKPRFFASHELFRRWLEKNHATAPELLVGFHKVHTGKPSLTWPQSVEAALCYLKLVSETNFQLAKIRL